MQVLTITGNTTIQLVTIKTFFIDIFFFFRIFCRERRIFPLALVNYITHSGGGFSREPGAKIKNFTMDELIENVSF